MLKLNLLQTLMKTFSPVRLVSTVSFPSLVDEATMKMYLGQIAVSPPTYQLRHTPEHVSVKAFSPTGQPHPTALLLLSGALGKTLGTERVSAQLGDDDQLSLVIRHDTASSKDATMRAVELHVTRTDSSHVVVEDETVKPSAGHSKP